MKRLKLVTCTDCGVSFRNVAEYGVHKCNKKFAEPSVVEQITAKRGPVYGPFLHNAIVAQNVKAAMRNIPDPDNQGLNWDALPVDVRESLDLMALKISRIVTGDPEYLDNWDDIGGYAKIVADRIRAKQEK